MIYTQMKLQQLYVYYKLFIVACFSEMLCKLPEDGDNAETCSR